jgi:hypothetical protein
MVLQGIDISASFARAQYGRSSAHSFFEHTRINTVRQVRLCLLLIDALLLLIDALFRSLSVLSFASLGWTSVESRVLLSGLEWLLHRSTLGSPRISFAFAGPPCVARQDAAGAAREPGPLHGPHSRWALHPSLMADVRRAACVLFDVCPRCVARCACLILALLTDLLACSCWMPPFCGAGSLFYQSDGALVVQRVGLMLFAAAILTFASQAEVRVGLTPLLSCPGRGPCGLDSSFVFADAFLVPPALAFV